MDHLMPGMDGLQAVQAIKSNPQTAMIPIMMYTSQEGELYVGQARALGAMGVLPKQVRPVDVSKVLYELHLLPDRRDMAEPALVPVEIEAGAPVERPAAGRVGHSAAGMGAPHRGGGQAAVRRLAPLHRGEPRQLCARGSWPICVTAPLPAPAPLPEPQPLPTPRRASPWPWAAGLARGASWWRGLCAVLWITSREDAGQIPRGDRGARAPPMPICSSSRGRARCDGARISRPPSRPRRRIRQPRPALGRTAAPAAAAGLPRSEPVPLR